MTDNHRSIQDTMILVKRAQAEDEEALQDLFERYLPRVRQLAAMRLGHTSSELLDVDDVTQEAMVDAFQNLNSFEEGSDGKFSNWLATLVTNRIRMALRAGRQIKRGGGQVQRFTDEPAAEHPSHMRGKDATPSQEAVGNELTEEIERVLLELPEAYREVLLQRYFSQMSYGEIAESMGMANTGAVRALYSRALAQLRDRLDSGGQAQ